MKTSIALLAALCAISGIVRAEISPVMLRVEQVTSVDHAKFKKTQEKSLKIFISNTSTSDLGNLKVKYYFFGHGVKEHESEVVDKGEKTASVKARETVTVESEDAKATAVEQHYVATRGGLKSSSKKGSGFNKGKQVAASGEKLTGYGVQVLSDGKVIADYFSEPSLKEKVGGGKP